MASDDVKDATGVKALSVNDQTSNGVTEKWGLELPHLYQLAVKFYKGKIVIRLKITVFANVLVCKYAICMGNKLFVLPKLTNIITETAESITESECNRNADSITEMASFITDATK